jgi:hypothetical protein
MAIDSKIASLEQSVTDLGHVKSKHALLRAATRRDSL